MSQEKSGSPLLRSEDWWAVWLGLLIFILALGKLTGADLLGWVVKTNLWIDFSKALSPVSIHLAETGFSGFTSLILTYIFLLVLTTIGAAAMRFNALYPLFAPQPFKHLQRSVLRPCVLMCPGSSSGSASSSGLLTVA
jgi:hypothetical protein